MKKYNNTSRTTKEFWGIGDWVYEPDKAHWIDEKTNLDCLIVRADGGSLCGYVGVPSNHPFYGKGYSELYEEDISVHGGLTYSDSCQDTPHESIGVCHTPDDDRPEDLWWLGFDCAHSGDCIPRYDINYGGYRNFDYVMDQCKNLASQLSEAWGVIPTYNYKEDSKDEKVYQVW